MLAANYKRSQLTFQASKFNLGHMADAKMIAPVKKIIQLIIQHLARVILLALALLFSGISV